MNATGRITQDPRRSVCQCRWELGIGVFVATFPRELKHHEQTEVCTAAIDGQPYSTALSPQNQQHRVVL